MALFSDFVSGLIENLLNSENTTECDLVERKYLDGNGMRMFSRFSHHF